MLKKSKIGQPRLHCGLILHPVSECEVPFNPSQMCLKVAPWNLMFYSTLSSTHAQSNWPMMWHRCSLCNCTAATVAYFHFLLHELSLGNKYGKCCWSNMVRTIMRVWSCLTQKIPSTLKKYNYCTLDQSSPSRSHGSILAFTTLPDQFNFLTAACKGISGLHPHAYAVNCFIKRMRSFIHFIIILGWSHSFGKWLLIISTERHF